jgi:acyl-CoA reductase-like NAD-dependent aldehyde dehydrogenase
MQLFQTISPADNLVYCERYYTQDDELSGVLERARSAQALWKTSKLSERIEICERFLLYFELHADEIAMELSMQMGRPKSQAKNELVGMADRARYMMSIAERSLAPINIEDSTEFTRYIQRDPLGVVFVIAPWNYPYLTAINSIIPALLAGNSVVLKHSLQTPLCAERFVTAFTSAGLPMGVFSSVMLTHEQVEKTIQSEMIDYVVFTGSVAGGLSIQRAANNRFIPVGLELGGKDPAYVRSDVDLSFAVSQLVDGAFFNSGQSCCGVERIYVHHDVFDDFIEAYVSEIDYYRLGHPLEEGVNLGPMVSARASAWARSQVQNALTQGATALVDSQKFATGDLHPAYMPPQVLIDVNHNMSLMSEESFAPIVGIMSVRSDRDAVTLMNDSEFGLTASVWTEDDQVARTLGNEIRTGTFYQNRCDYLDPALVWTGVKRSGRGYSLSSLGFEQLTQAKSFHLKQTH